MELLGAIGVAGSFGISALGAAIAMGLGGPAVIGSYKKCYVQNKPAPFIMVVFAGTCLSNVIYGFIIMGALAASTLDPAMIFALGVGSGLCIGIVAITQSMCSASAADAFAETGKGFGNYMMVIGIAETVSLFAMVFTLLFA
ncbi:MAG: V-type ATP synthase subunit K [Treponema sp.]|jgi:V/A-type H+-transporting ATPase subunit K|nr:V-type ATP synthase subunit K [Treponema sp.]